MAEIRERCQQRRADKLASGVRALDDDTTSEMADEALEAVDQLVGQLARLQQAQQRRTRETVRRAAGARTQERQAPQPRRA